MLKCPYCQAEEVKLLIGAINSPKSLLRCEKCQRTFQRHQAGPIKRIGNNYRLFKEYCNVIARKFKEYKKVGEFLDHFITHMKETINICLLKKIPYKEKLVSLINLAVICSFILDEKDEITIDECMDALENHHKKTNRFSIGRDGEVKNI